MTKRLILLFILFIVGDIYFYQAFSTVFPQTFAQSLYWLVDALLLGSIMALVYRQRKGLDIHHLLAGVISSFLLVFIPKVFTLPILLVGDIFRLFQGFPARSVAFSEAVMLIALLLVGLIVFGLTKGRHLYRVRKEVLYFADLPAAFDGFTLTQLSDIHSGSLTDVKGVRKGIALANAQNSDLMLFTGDLVNHFAAEMDPWIADFAQLKAPYGQYSILGNHDYGDYVSWESEQLKAANLERLKAVHGEIGFKLLLNEAVTITKDGQSISLIGVENWGKAGFHQYGDLEKATAQVPSDAFKVLLSHDPSHWELVALKHPKPIHLTLSGHTHGMQFGLELFGIKWSPIQYFYKQWAGLYAQGGKYLYVNRGFGYHAFRGRVGVWPEITVIELRKGKA